MKEKGLIWTLKDGCGAFGGGMACQVGEKPPELGSWQYKWRRKDR